MYQAIRPHLAQHRAVTDNDRRARFVTVAGLALMFIVVLVSAAIRLGQTASPPLDAAALLALRAAHRTAASLEVLVVIWLGWLVWRMPSKPPFLVRDVALAAAMTLALSVLGILAGQSPPPPAAMANLLGGLALTAIFAGTLRILHEPAVRAPAVAAGIGAVLLAVQCLLGAQLSVFHAPVSFPALPAHAMLGIMLASGAAWLALRNGNPLRRTAGFALAILVPVAGFTVLHYEGSAAAAFAHAAAVALLLVVSAYTRLRPA